MSTEGEMNSGPQPDEPEADPVYLAAWDDLRRRMRAYDRAWHKLFALLFLNVVLLQAGKLYGPLLPLAILLFPVSAVFLGMTRERSAGQINSFRCPRCGGQFIKIDPQINSTLHDLKHRSDTECLNCELPLWSSRGDIPKRAEIVGELQRFGELLRGRYKRRS
jgi:hypothetical protein